MTLDLEIRRNLFHLIFGVAIAFYVLFVGRSISIISFAVGILICVFFADCLQRMKIPVLNWIIKKMEREGQIPGGGVLTFFIGSLIITSVPWFSMETVFIAIVLTAVIDSFTVFIGKYYGKVIIYQDKNFLGTFAGFLAGTLAVSPFLTIYQAAIVCLSGSIVELFLPYDNITIPITTATVLTILTTLI